jgi:hypothetical protein
MKNWLITMSWILCASAMGAPTDGGPSVEIRSRVMDACMGLSGPQPVSISSLCVSYDVLTAKRSKALAEYQQESATYREIGAASTSGNPQFDAAVKRMHVSLDRIDSIERELEQLMLKIHGQLS